MTLCNLVRTSYGHQRLQSSQTLCYWFAVTTLLLLLYKPRLCPPWDLILLS